MAQINHFAVVDSFNEIFVVPLIWTANEGYVSYPKSSIKFARWSGILDKPIGYGSDLTPPIEWVQKPARIIGEYPDYEEANKGCKCLEVLHTSEEECYKAMPRKALASISKYST